MTDADLRANSEIENEEAIVAEIAELMGRMKQIYQRESRAERQVQAVAKRSAPKRESNEYVRMVCVVCVLGGG